VPKAYHFSEEQIAELEIAKTKNKNKNVDKRLEALLRRARNESRQSISEKTGFTKQWITAITSTYHKNGLESIVGNHYKANHRNLSFEQEAELLKEFEEQAQKGQLVSIDEIKRAYEERIGRSIEKSHSHIYQLLERHGFRKVMPRSRHPKKASPEAIEASKKLIVKFGN
jgi:transposase